MKNDAIALLKAGDPDGALGALQTQVRAAAEYILQNREKDDLIALQRSGKENILHDTVNSHTAWLLLRNLAAMDTAYGEGDYEKVVVFIDEIVQNPVWLQSAE